MFAEFAVEPAAMVTNIDRFRGMIDRFGVEHGRIVSDFAEGRWSAAVIQHALANGLGDVALASVEERLRQKRDQKGIARFGRAYPGAAGGWITNALEADAVQPFAGIVVEQSCGHERECCAATAHSDQPPLHVAGFIDIPRNAAEIAAVAAPLIRLSRKLHLIDPHITFDGTAQVISKWANPLVALLGECRPAMEVTIHTYATGNGKPPAYLFEQHARARLQPLPAGVGLRLQRWVRRNGGEDFHDRAILTDIGGMTFGNGLDEGAPGTRVGVQRLDRHGWMTWLAKFTPETSPYDAEASIVLQQVGTP